MVANLKQSIDNQSRVNRQYWYDGYALAIVAGVLKVVFVVVVAIVVIVVVVVVVVGAAVAVAVPVTVVVVSMGLSST